MDNETISMVTNMGVNLAELAVKGTAVAIHGKIEAIKKEKDLEKVRSTYDEIISELLSEKQEAILIAQAYKEELQRVVISDEDIDHLHNTVTRVLDIFKQMNPENQAIDSFEKCKELIAVDTLKTMQLLGFNYKAAIGEPLTELCANAISGLYTKGKNKNSGFKKLSK